SGPSIIRRASSRSSIERASGPTTCTRPCNVTSFGRKGSSNEGAGSWPVDGTRPAVGRRAKIPVQCAGHRTDPPKSVPRPRGEQCAAIAAASPPLEPPGVTGPTGFLVAPQRHDGVEAWVHAVDLPEVRLDDLGRRGLTGADDPSQLGGGAFDQFHDAQIVHPPSAAGQAGEPSGILRGAC